MKKVLYVSPNGYLGGAERFVLTAAKNHTTINSSILFYSQGEAYQESLETGIDTYVLNRKFRLSNVFKLLMALIEIRKVVKHVQPDIIHSTMPYAHITMSLATIGLNIKKVWFQHGPVGGRLDQIANFFPVDALLYNSQDIKERHHKTSPKAKIYRREDIIRLGVPVQEFTARKFTHPIKLGTAGRICSWKGFHNLLEALAKIKDKPWELQIAGNPKNTSDNQYLEDLRGLINKYNIQNRVVFLNHVKDMKEFYNSRDVFIHCSLIPEPFGLVVAEAMASGCFIIGSNLGGVKDILIDNETGFSYSSTSENAVSELISTLNKLLESSPEPLQEMAKNAYAHIKNNYSIQGMILQLEEIYQALRK